MTNDELTAVTSQIEKLIDHGKLVHYKAGQVLFYEEHQPYGAYVIHSGTIDFSSSDCKCSEEKVFSISDGQLVGVDHILDGTPFCCTCSAATDCKITFIPKAAIKDAAHQPSSDRSN